MTITWQDLRAEVETTLAGAGYFDLDAITDTLWDDTYRTVDAVPGPAFWRLAGRHEQPAPDPAGDFRRDLSAAISGQRAGRDALWTDGVVTVRARGVSRVNQALPQPTAEFVVETILDSRQLGETASWEALWSAVVELGDDARARAGWAEAAVRTAVIAHHSATARIMRTRAERDEAIRAAARAGVQAASLAEMAGLSEAGIRKIMQQ